MTVSLAFGNTLIGIYIFFNGLFFYELVELVLPRNCKIYQILENESKLKYWGSVNLINNTI